MSNQKQQLPLNLKPRYGWGGARPNSGPKPSGKAGVPHRTRPELSRHHPVHVTLRLVRGLPNLRSKKPFAVLRRSFAAAKERLDMRLVHFSVQGNHLHLIVEAADRTALGRAMRGLQIRMARGLNRLYGRVGRVFADRYHARAMKTPRETRNGLAYVLLNARRHAFQRGLDLRNDLIDPCSSGLAFDGWKGKPILEPTESIPIAPPHTWLLRSGWRRRGLISPSEIPASA
jgi:REP element-mobilizing transposase RayT